MKHLLSQQRTMTKLIIVASLCLFALASESADAESQRAAVVSLDQEIGVNGFGLRSWTYCADRDWTMSERYPRMGGDPSLCNGEIFDGDYRDRAGLRRDTWYFLGYQAATVGILYAMPESVSGWSTEQKEGYSLSIWWDNVTHPKIDSDDFYINYLLHPYWGAAYFVRARERGYSNGGSFWYSVLLSSAYEFGAEALFEEPSIQDIVVTPVAGSLVGLYFMRIRDNIRERDAALGHRATKDKWLWVLTDPLGSLNGKIDRIFGWETDLHIRPYSYVHRRDPGMPLAIPRNNDRVYGLEFRLRW